MLGNFNENFDHWLITEPDKAPDEKGKAPHIRLAASHIKQPSFTSEAMAR